APNDTQLTSPPHRTRLKADRGRRGWWSDGVAGPTAWPNFGGLVGLLLARLLGPACAPPGAVGSQGQPRLCGRWGSAARKGEKGQRRVEKASGSQRRVEKAAGLERAPESLSSGFLQEIQEIPYTPRDAD